MTKKINVERQEVCTCLQLPVRVTTLKTDQTAVMQSKTACTACLMFAMFVKHVVGLHL